MATALELTRDGWNHYIKTASRRPPPELTVEEKETREKLLSRIREVAFMLKSRFGVRRVWLFGSLAQASWFTSDSDVDLAVEGLKIKEYWEAWKLIEEIIKDRPVDFIEIETASQSLKEAIERNGVEL